MKKINKKLNKRAKNMIIASFIAFAVLAIATPISFFASINNEWQTRKDIQAISSNLDVFEQKNELTDIAQNDRILEIIAVDKDGLVLYTLKGMSLFQHSDATAAYDSQTGLIKFEGGRISYFERSSILGALLNFGDNDTLDDFDDDDDIIPAFDYKFVEDNTYQTIIIDDSGAGNRVYIVCSQQTHTGFILYFVLSIVFWSLFVAYLLIVATYIIVKLSMPVCKICEHRIRRGNSHCTKCGTSLLPRHCQSCNAITKDDDIVCGKCGVKLE